MLTETEKNHETRLRNLEGANVALAGIITHLTARLGGEGILNELADYFIARDVEKGAADNGLYLLALKHINNIRGGLGGKPQLERIDA
jgi:hypothetical protein